MAQDMWVPLDCRSQYGVVLSGGLRWERGEEGRSIEHRSDNCSLDTMIKRFRTRIVTHYYYYYYLL